jgi:hypothetical protein
LLFVLLAASCGTRPKSRCERVCAREHDCAQKLKRDGFVSDQGECEETCGQLERDPQTQRFVDVHVKCVDEAQACAQVLDCP